MKTIKMFLLTSLFLIVGTSEAQKLRFGGGGVGLKIGDVVTGGTNGLLFYNNGGLFGEASILHWDDINLRLGIGTASPGVNLEIAVAAGSNPAIWFSDGDVNHGMTDFVQTDVGFRFDVASSVAGGSEFSGYTDAANVTAVFIQGHLGNSNPNDDVPAIRLRGWKKDGGTGRQVLADVETVLGIGNGTSIDIVVMGSGRLGIGTITPDGLLNVESLTTDSEIFITADNTSISALYLGDEDDNNIGFIKYHHAKDSLEFGINNAVAMTILSDKTVGIGLSSPGARLELKSSGTEDIFIAAKDISDTDNGYVKIDQFGTMLSFVPTGASNWVGFGLVGHGDASARYAFGLDSGTPFMGFGPGNAGRDVFLRRESADLAFTFGTSPSEKVRFTSAGSVGIRTSTPDEALDVNSSVTQFDSLKVHRERSSIVDDGTIIPTTGVSGWGFVMIGDNQESSSFTFTVAGVVTLAADATANVVNTDTDTNLCIFDNGSGIAIKNRLGSTLTVAVNIKYYTP